MNYFVGLDVSVRTTSICVLNEAGAVVREGKVESEPEAIAKFLAEPGRRYVRVGIEAGPLCQWLYAGLAKVGLPVICIETRHAQAVLSAQVNKTDRNDARGIPQMMRVGLYRPVHVKTLASQQARMLLTSASLGCTAGGRAPRGLSNAWAAPGYSVTSTSCPAVLSFWAYALHTATGL